MTATEYKKTAVKPTKYRNKKTVINGVTFDSKREADRWIYLKAREDAGEISHLERQPKFLFFIHGQSVKYDSGRQLYYKADFSYFDGNNRVVEDSKGFRTREYLIKKALVQAMYPAVKIIEV